LAITGWVAQTAWVFEAVVFDFDGLILDTETPLYLAWAKTFQHFGAPPIDLAEWSVSLGRHDDDPAMLDPMDRLRDLLDRPLEETEVQTVRRAFCDELLEAMLVRPGVEALLDEADQLDVPVAIASSSPVAWIEQHLGPTGLRERFAVLSCAGHGVPGKPDPAVYLQACGAVGADPRRSLALEDSPNGTAAAKRAGMTCVVVPTEISRTLDFGQADAVLSSLDDLSLSGW
jgi:HAD superfamily hydrolase (TIGR01509 family)